MQLGCRLLVLLATPLLSSASDISAGAADAAEKTAADAKAAARSLGGVPLGQPGTVQLKKVLFTTMVTVDGTPHLLAVHDGDAPAQVAQDFGLVHGLSVDGIDTVARHITQKAGKFLKRVFFHLPFYVEVEGKSQMMNLTVYEDSNPSKLAEKVAQKFKLPPSSAARIRIEIEAQMVKRVQLRVSVDLQDGGPKQALLVYRDETPVSASRRFSLQHGLTMAGQNNLATHLAAQLAKSPAKPFPTES